jgi:hypothetical protein
MIKIVHEAPLGICKNVWTAAQLVMNQVLLCNGGNDYKLPHVGNLKISAAAIGRDIPMRLPCRALIAGDHLHLNVDAITAAITAKDQGTPARLFLIVVSFHRCPLSQLIPPSINRACRYRPSIVRAAAIHPSIVRAAAVHQ